jgi:valyl-tRNA synthetase
MQPELAPGIEAATRRQFADGIPSFGTDALRFTFCSLATQGRDIRFDLGRIEGYRNFCNKLWNAARFVEHHTEGRDCAIAHDSDFELGLAERWITSRLQQTEQAVGEAFASYRLDLAAQAIYEFFWNEYCDWYLEFTKSVLFDDNSAAALQRGTRRTLLRVLETMLRLAHPLVPFITEDIWQQVRDSVGKQGPSIMSQPYPIAQPERIDTDSLREMQWVQDFVLGVRRIRGEMDVKPGMRLDVLLSAGDANDDARAAAHSGYLSSLAGLNSITRQATDQPPPQSAKVLLGGLEVLIPLEGLIDKDAELARIDRELTRLEKELARSQGKLTNEKFIARAPLEVVEQERTRVAQFNESVDKLHAQRKLLGP